MELQKLHHLPPPITSKTLVTLVAEPQLLHTCAPMADITFQSAAPHTYQPWNQFLSTIQSMNQALQQDRYSNQQPSVYHQSPPPNPTHQNFNQPVLNSSIPNLEKLDEVDEWIGASLHQQQRREAMRDGDREFLKPVKSMLELVRSHNPRSLHSLSNQAIMQPSYPHPHSSVMVNHTSSMNLNQNPVQSPHLNRATSHQELFRSSLSMVNLNLTQPHTSSFTHIATDPPNITQSQFNPTQVTQPLPQYTQGPPYLNHPQPNPSDVTQTIPSYNHSNWNTPRFVPSHNSIPYTEPYRPYQDPYNNQNQQNYHYPNQVNQGSSIEKIFSCRGFSPGNQYCACLGCGGTTPEVATSENPVQEGCNELGNQFQRVLPQRSQAVPEQSSPKPLEKSTFQADWASAPTKSFQESAIQITPQQQRTYSLGFSSESSHGGQTIPLLSLPDPFQSSQPLGSIEASQQEQFPAHTSGIVGSVRVGVNTVSDSQTCFKALRVVKVQKKIEKARKLRKNPKEKYKEQFSGSIEHDWFKEFVFVAPPAQKHVRKHNSHEMEEKLSMIGINTFDVEGIQLLSFNQEEIMSVEAANQEVKAANRWIRKLQREFKEKYKETITHPMFRVQHLRQQSHNIRMEITREMAYRLELPLLSLIHSHFQFRKSHIRSLSTDLTRFSTAHTSVRYGSSFLIPCGQGISKERALSRYISGDGGDVGGREEKGSGEKEETEMNGQSLSNNTMGFGPELSAKVGFGPKLPDDGPGAGESGPRLGESKLRRGTCARIARLAGPWIDRLASDVIGGYQQSCLPPQVQAIPATISRKPF